MNPFRDIASRSEGDFADGHGEQSGRRPGPATRPEVDVVVIGHTGQVGSAVAERMDRLGASPDRPGLVLREAINRSRHLIHDRHGVRELRRTTQSLSGLAHRLSAGDRPAVIVDCSADPHLPGHYPEWLSKGIGVVTPNKHGLSGDRMLHERIRKAARHGRAPLAYSATVGAGLPILSAIDRLRRAGERPAGIAAGLSGTLVHVFNRMAAGSRLSEAVLDARARGYTEPDPLEDLSGRDVQRKLVIMLREAGLDHVPVEREPVVPDELAARTDGQEDVVGILRSFDEHWQRRISRAAARDRLWCYVARFDGMRARVRPEPVRRGDPLAGLRGADNLVRIELTADPETPVLIRGPGAGVAVTAAAVMADLAQVAAELLTRARPGDRDRVSVCRG